MEEVEAMAFTCPACGGEFDSQDELESHARLEHGGTSVGGFWCLACGEEFGSREGLHDHEKAEHAA